MLDEIEAKLQGHVHYYNSTIHGISHLREVSLLAGELAPPEFKKAAMIAGFLHDIGRKNDFGGRQHAIDSAIIARPLIANIWPQCDIEKICYAIEHHADGLTTCDPLIGSIWDADRLTLSRLGCKINTKLLSTPAAKNYLSSRRASILHTINDGSFPTTIDRLQYCTMNGYLLHGSPNKGLSYLRGNRERPLCATQTPLYAMMYATTPTLHANVSIWDADFFFCEWWPPFNPNPIPTIKATPSLIQNLAPGCIYVLESDKFKQGKHGVEFIAHEPITPIATIDISPSDVLPFIKPISDNEIKLLREYTDDKLRNDPPAY